VVTLFIGEQHRPQVDFILSRFPISTRTAGAAPRARRSIAEGRKKLAEKQAG